LTYKLEKMKSYTLGLLLLSSVNALGHECYINVNDESAYVLQLSVYSYLNDINTCKCQSGYEFKNKLNLCRNNCLSTRFEILFYIIL
jgi:hypothetical protein